MKAVPTSADVEATAVALAGLHARGLQHWSAERLAHALRQRTTLAATEALAFMERCGVVERVRGGWTPSLQGRATLGALSAGQWEPMARAALTGPDFSEELHRLLEVGEILEGRLRCPLRRAQRSCPTASSVLAWVPEHRQGLDLVIPIALLEELLATASMKEAATVPDWVRDRESVGWRAELYSLRRERARYGSEGVLHISRDTGDGFGYDIECTGTTPPRMIEVKGSRSADVTFVITARELAVAGRHSDRYELHYWGGISLTRPPEQEYPDLLDAGYPLVITNVAKTLAMPDWTRECTAWRFRLTS